MEKARSTSHRFLQVGLKYVSLDRICKLALLRPANIRLLLVFVKSCFNGMQSCSLAYLLPTAPFMLQQQNLALAAESIWHTKSGYYLVPYKKNFADPCSSLHNSSFRNVFILKVQRMISSFKENCFLRCYTGKREK